MPPDPETMLREHDAGLLIGDAALKVDRAKYIAYDLAEEWIRFTGKSFVFAFWAVRKDALREASSKLDLPEIFQESRDHGLEPENVDEIARIWGPRLGMSLEDVRHYLLRNIHYQLDPPCIEGLELFYKYAQECGALPAARPLRFLETSAQALTG